MIALSSVSPGFSPGSPGSSVTYAANSFGPLLSGMDATIYLGGRLLPGAAEVVDFLQRMQAGARLCVIGTPSLEHMKTAEHEARKEPLQPSQEATVSGRLASACHGNGRISRTARS